jgi:hypothetical protein
VRLAVAVEQVNEPGASDRARQRRREGIRDRRARRGRARRRGGAPDRGSPCPRRPGPVSSTIGRSARSKHRRRGRRLLASPGRSAPATRVPVRLRGRARGAGASTSWAPDRRGRGNAGGSRSPGRLPAAKRASQSSSSLSSACAENPLIERVRQRTRRTWPSSFTVSAPACRCDPSVPSPWYPTNRIVAVGSSIRLRRWPRTRPPVSIPLDATIMYGRGARAIACDAFTSLVTIWFG